jgi:hypoxanthine phosphoribosyltransferase
MDKTEPDHQELPYKHILYPEKEIRRRIDEMAVDITGQYWGEKPLFVCLLKGGTLFASKLMSAITRQDLHFHPQLSYMLVRTYGGEREAGTSEIVLGLDEKSLVTARHIVIVDDVLDTGTSALATAEYLRAKGAAHVDLIVLVQKQKKRVAWQNATMYGFETPDEWITGMGMDDVRVAPEGNRWLEVIAIAN